MIHKFKKIVINIASFSNNPKIKVGAIIIKDNRIISIGYNGELPGEPHKRIEIRGHNVADVHAEQNCIMFCAKHGISINDCEMLVTHYPCNNCTKFAIISGIKKIYYINDYKNKDNMFTHKIKIIKC